MMRQRTSPPLTLGLPVYNGEAYLKETLQSLQSQSFSSFELHVSDNFSTDRSRDIIKEAAFDDPRVFLHCNTQNIGASRNFNHVVDYAYSEFFAWVNHDDLWSPTYLERCIAALRSDAHAVLAYSKSAKISADGSMIAPLRCDLTLDAKTPRRRLRTYHNHFIAIDQQGDWSDDSIEGLWIPIYGVIRTDVLRQTPLIGNYISSDTVLLELLMAYGKFVEVDELLFFKRDHPNRSMRESVAYTRRVEWFTGNSPGFFLFPRMTILAQRLKVVASARIRLTDRIACLFEMLAFYGRRPHEAKAIAKEAAINLRRVIAHVLGRPQRLPDKW